MGVTTFAPGAIAAACRLYGAQLAGVPAGINPVQLLWAIAGNESSFGRHCTPRHEPAYDVGGRYATGAPMPVLLQRYGAAAACSYGPWQVMLCNAPQGYAPASFDTVDASAAAAVLILNTLLRHWKPETLAEIGECYNAGREVPDPDYTNKLAKNYQVPMPPAPAAALAAAA